MGDNIVVCAAVADAGGSEIGRERSKLGGWIVGVNDCEFGLSVGDAFGNFFLVPLLLLRDGCWCRCCGCGGGCCGRMLTW